MLSARGERLDNPWLWRLSNGAVAGFAFLLVWYCGHRGVFLQDQSMVFDGAWRLLQGQVPYRDTLYPFGPVTFLIQELFFKLFGVNFSATVISAAVLNAIAALIVVRIVRRLFPREKSIAVVAGVVTACWFQAPFGTLWFEQTAFFFALLALFAVLEGELSGSSWRYPLHALGGFLLAWSVLSKQNAGILFWLVMGGMALGPPLFGHWISESLRRFGAQIGGFVAGAAGFLIWLWLFSDPAQFFRSTIEISRSLAAERAPRSPVMFLGGLLSLSAYPLSVRWCALVFLLIGAAGLLAGGLRWLRHSDQARIYCWAGWMVVSCVFFQQLFLINTYNEAEDGLPFLGLCAGLALSMLSSILGPHGTSFSLSSGPEILEAKLSPVVTRRIMTGASIIFSALLILPGVRVSWKRYVQQFRTETRFEGRLDVGGLSRLEWADFSYEQRTLLVDGVRRSPEGTEWWLRKADFTGLNHWLDQNPGNFFVFGDATMLYGLHRRVSPQPWLYFTEGHSFLGKDLARVDEVVTASLRRNQIATVILEKVSWEGSQDAAYLNRMQRLGAWITSNFHKDKEFGIYEVWMRNTGAQ